MKELEYKRVKNIVNRYGKEIDYSAAVIMMDDDVRETTHNDLAPCTDQEFFDGYCARHILIIGETWVLDDPNPVW